jgi:hypothetical protein
MDTNRRPVHTVVWDEKNEWERFIIRWHPPPLEMLTGVLGGDVHITA